MKKIILIAGWVFLSVVGIGAANGQTLSKQEHAVFGERAVTTEEIKMFELLFQGEKKEGKRNGIPAILPRTHLAGREQNPTGKFL